MGVVSEIKEYRGRVSVSVDGYLLARMSSRHFKKCPLEEGQAIDDEAYLSEVAELQYPEAYEAALTRLESCARTEQDMRTALSRKGYVDLAVDRVLMRLTRAGLLNDQEYAQRFVESRTHRPVGRYQISRQLRQKGVDRDTAQAALEQIDDEQQQNAALELARKLSARYAGQPARSARAKLSQAMARRGFSWDDISWALNQLEEQDALFSEDEWDFE